MIIKYGTGFIITLVVDEKFLDVALHSRMLVNWQNTSPSQYLRNPTFGVIATTERLFSKPQTTGGGNDFLEFLVQPRWGWLDLLASTSRDVVLAKKVWERIQKIDNLKQLQTHFKAKREKGVGTPFPPNYTLEYSISYPFPSLLY